MRETKNQLKMQLIKRKILQKNFLKSVEEIQKDTEEGKTKATFIMDQTNCFSKHVIASYDNN